MEEKIQKLYDYYYEELLKCPVSDNQKSHFIGGKQQALEDLAVILDINLKIKNLVTICEKINEIDSKYNLDQFTVRID